MKNFITNLIDLKSYYFILSKPPKVILIEFSVGQIRPSRKKKKKLSL